MNCDRCEDECPPEPYDVVGYPRLHFCCRHCFDAGQARGWLAVMEEKEATANNESSKPGGLKDAFDARDRVLGEIADAPSRCLYCGDECPAPRRFVNLGDGFCTDSCSNAWHEKRPASPLSQHPDAYPTPSAPISPLQYITANALGFLEGTVITALRSGDLLVAREHIELMIAEEES